MAHHYVRVRKLGEGGHGDVYLERAVGGPVVRLLRRLRAREEADAAAAAAPPSSPASSASTASRSRKRARGTPGEEEKRDDEADDPMLVAVKRIRVMRNQEGVSMEAIRELRLMQELEHPNLLPVLEVFARGRNIHLVLERMHGDLEEMVNEPRVVLRDADRKAYMGMMLRSVEYIHSRFVLHRDIKPSNFLLAPNGAIKLADFGLAKLHGSPDRKLSHQACTLWYRAPELLFGSRSYGPPADMWSVGCVFAEIMLRVPMFAGQSEIDQLSRIVAFLGSPSEQRWPGCTRLPSYTEFERREPNDFRALFTGAPDDAVDLLRHMLVWDPSKRITAAEALRHPYMLRGVRATPLAELPRLPEKRKRQKQQQQQQLPEE